MDFWYTLYTGLWYLPGYPKKCPKETKHQMGKNIQQAKKDKETKFLKNKMDSVSLVLIKVSFFSRMPEFFVSTACPTTVGRR